MVKKPLLKKVYLVGTGSEAQTKNNANRIEFVIKLVIPPQLQTHYLPTLAESHRASSDV